MQLKAAIESYMLFAVLLLIPIPLCLSNSKRLGLKGTAILSFICGAAMFCLSLLMSLLRGFAYIPGYSASAENMQIKITFWIGVFCIVISL